MDYSKTKLYGIKRKRDLAKLLSNELKNDFIKSANKSYSPYIIKNPKPRLIENPHEPLKKVQRKIKNLLFELDYPENVYSGIPKRSYIDNAIYHINSDYFLKIDLSKFFPNTHREKIYNFYRKKLVLSPDIAKILTDFSSVNLEEISNREIKDFLNQKKIMARNHLPSGSPISSVLSYLANIDMFEEIQELCANSDCIVSFYVDDITVSSKKPIPKSLLNVIEKIINKNFHSMNISKTRTYFTNDFKKITGCIISSDKKLVIPNKTMYKITSLINGDVLEEKELQKLSGLIRTAQMYEKDKFLSLQIFVKRKKEELKKKKRWL